MPGTSGAEAADASLSRALATALRRVVTARDHLEAQPLGSDAHQSALAGYLEAAVHHLAVLAVAQAQQNELLSAEVAELRARLDALGPTLH
ncbi:MAG: hypothetical protein U1E23_13055 [Reyranellaceae bacterium]